MTRMQRSNRGLFGGRSKLTGGEGFRSRKPGSKDRLGAKCQDGFMSHPVKNKKFLKYFSR